MSLEKGGYSIFTHTPALSVTESTGSSGTWTVNTSRGSITATKVIHATNAYASALLPEMKGMITPTKGELFEQL
jgi:glycine/D-amino acid oxidase-like deaminating enzyme